MRHLITLVEDLRDRGIEFRSLQEGAIDTTSASAELIFNIFSALAQFERRLIQERTKAGLAVARARGRRGGRPRIEGEEAKVLAAKKLANDRSLSINDICETLKISRSTYYRYLSMDADRGILFACLNTDIERQFEFVQQTRHDFPDFGVA